MTFQIYCQTAQRQQINNQTCLNDDIYPFSQSQDSHKKQNSAQLFAILMRHLETLCENLFVTFLH